MNGLLANLQKDARLFLHGLGGWLSLLLPVVLIAVLLVGLHGDAASKRAYVQPFAIAVRDRDDTPMSRSLFDQLSRVDLIETVTYATDAQTDEQLFAEGYAAVVTLPKDFFYVIYDMQNEPVQLVLNGAMPTETTVFETMITSVLRIVGADQAAAVAVLQYTGAQADDAFYYEAANRIFSDALARGQVFSPTETAAETAAQKTWFFVSAVCAMVCMFLPLGVLKTLPEEMSLGVFARYRTAGGSTAGLIGSKLLCALLLNVPCMAVLLLIAGASITTNAILTLLVCFLASFFSILLLALWQKSAARTQLLGNTLLLAVLVLGGAFYPYELLPAFIQPVARFLLPYALRSGAVSVDWAQLVQSLWPVAMVGLVAAAVSVLLLAKKGRAVR